MGNGRYGPSPLESLAAFAIAFVAGALSVISAKIYADHINATGDDTSDEMAAD